MSSNIFGEYNIILKNGESEKTLNIKNKITPLLKSYINYGCFYINENQFYYYGYNNLHRRDNDTKDKNTYTYASLNTLKEKFDNYPIRGSSLNGRASFINLYLFNTDITDIYAESLKGNNGKSLPPMPEFSVQVDISDVNINKNKNQLELKFKTYPRKFNTMNANKIMLMYNPGKPFFYDSDNYFTENQYYDTFDSGFLGQISEATLEEPIIITEETIVSIEYFLTIDYTNFLNGIKGSFVHKYYDLNGVYKEKTIEYLIKSSLVIQIENIIKKYDHLEQKFLNTLEKNKNFYKYTDEECENIKTKFKEIFWDSSNGMYTNIKKYLNSDKNNTMLASYINRTLVPDRLDDFKDSPNLDLYTDHGYYSMLFDDNNENLFFSDNHKNYPLEKYILNDNLSFEDKIKMIQFYINVHERDYNLYSGLGIWNTSDYIFTGIPSFRLRNDTEFLNQTLQPTKFNKSLNNLIKSNYFYLYSNSITTGEYFNNYKLNPKMHRIFGTSTSWTFSLYTLDKENYLEIINNFKYTNNIYNKLNSKKIYPGMFFFKPQEYAFGIYFSEPITFSPSFSYSFDLDFEFGIN